MKSLGFSLDDYSEVIASICDGANGAVDHSDDNVGGECPTEGSKLATTSLDGAAQAWVDDQMATGTDNILSHVSSLALTEMEWDVSNQPEAVTAGALLDMGTTLSMSHSWNKRCKSKLTKFRSKRKELKAANTKIHELVEAKEEQGRTLASVVEYLKCQGWQQDVDMSAIL
ncbi:hypothetical protein Acr_00g0101000 [Actinidia rufa]|uniref:Uncharacterized protein n=1 Tax=Actinidia rufa TaxID=165716 RepID=A0A7J0DZX9_9ERIC|nr:hypothetical protein Acr_00g0101000 [Actinidia rufa]